MALKYKHNILLVDDEVSITNSLQRLFRKEKYRIFTASSGQDALDQMRQADKPISLIISDQRMPGMTGAEFLEKAKKIFPNGIRFLLTGYSDMDAVVDAVNKGRIHRYITKPWNGEDLILQVRHGLEQYELVVENRRLLSLTKKQNRQLEELNHNLEQKVEERSKEIIMKNKELSRLNKELESNLYNTVRAFASLAELHAPGLAGHGRRVSLLSREVAELMELSDEEVTQIEIAALLHDIGKLGLPEKLMNYEEKKWTPEEEALFKRHPEEGQSIVRFINKLDNVGLLIRSHHERYDGQGYPDQLSEISIPTGSKIIAVANVYDRIVNLRVNIESYIKDFSKDKETTQDHLSEEELVGQVAAHHIKQRAFTSFDPDVVKVFLELLKRKGTSFKREKEISVEALEQDMVLSRPLYSSKGRFLLPHGTTLTSDFIQKLKTLHERAPISEKVYVSVDQ